MAAAMLLILASSALAEPNLGQLIGPENYPTNALASNRSAALHLELEIGSDGRVKACRPLSFVGDQSLAAVICPTVQRRRISPGRLPDGSAAPARLRTFIRMTVPGTPGAALVANASQPADVEFTVTTLPKAAKSLETNVVIAVGLAGEMLECQAAKFAKNLHLVATACSSLRTMTFTPIVDQAGQPTRYVTTQRVKFIAP